MRVAVENLLAQHRELRRALLEQDQLRCSDSSDLVAAVLLLATAVQDCEAKIEEIRTRL